mgnify:CR=1 FL=1
MDNDQLVTISEAADLKLKELLDEHSDQGSYLRMMIMPNSQGGYQYALGIEENEGDGDLLIDGTGDIKVLIDSNASELIKGTEIDYVDGLMRSGFVISNPNLPVSSGGGGCGGGGGGCACGNDSAGGGCGSADGGCGSGGGGCGSGGCGGGCGGH